MATASQVITRALKRLRVLPSGTTQTSDETTDCLEALNDMLHEWSIDGIDLAHTTLLSTDALDVPDDHIGPIADNLAMRVADMFGAQVSQLLAMDAQAGKAALVAYHFTIADLTDDNPLGSSNLASED